MAEAFITRMVILAALTTPAGVLSGQTSGCPLTRSQCLLGA